MRPAILASCVLSLSGACLLVAQNGQQAVPPSAQRQNEILENVRDYVLGNTENVFNLDLTLVQRRYLARNPGQWELQSVERTPGSSARMAEYRTLLREPFEPATLTSFRWDHWGRLRGRMTYVFSYTVERSASVRLYSGLIYVDAEQETVLRITRKTAAAPATSRVYEVSTILDYPLAGVGVGRVVPSKAEEQVLSEGLSTKTVVEVQLAPARLKPVTEVALAHSK